MKGDKDPKKLFEQISAVRNIHNNLARKIYEEDLIAVVLDAAPAQYKAVLTAKQQACQKIGSTPPLWVSGSHLS